MEISALVPEEKGKADDGPKGGGSGWRSGIRNIRWPASFASFSWSLFSEEGKQRYGRLNGIIMPAGAMSKKHACYQFSVAAGILKSQSYRCLIFFMGIPPRVAAAQLIAGPERSIQFKICLAQFFQPFFQSSSYLALHETTKTVPPDEVLWT